MGLTQSAARPATPPLPSIPSLLHLPLLTLAPGTLSEGVAYDKTHRRLFLLLRAGADLQLTRVENVTADVIGNEGRNVTAAETVTLCKDFFEDPDEDSDYEVHEEEILEIKLAANGDPCVYAVPASRAWRPMLYIHHGEELNHPLSRALRLNGVVRLRSDDSTFQFGGICGSASPFKLDAAFVFSDGIDVLVIGTPEDPYDHAIEVAWFEERLGDVWTPTLRLVEMVAERTESLDRTRFRLIYRYILMPPREEYDFDARTVEAVYSSFYVSFVLSQQGTVMWRVTHDYIPVQGPGVVLRWKAEDETIDPESGDTFVDPIESSAFHDVPNVLLKCVPGAVIASEAESSDDEDEDDESDGEEKNGPAKHDFYATWNEDQSLVIHSDRYDTLVDKYAGRKETLPGREWDYSIADCDIKCASDRVPDMVWLDQYTLLVAWNPEPDGSAADASGAGAGKGLKPGWTLDDLRAYEARELQRRLTLGDDDTEGPCGPIQLTIMPLRGLAWTRARHIAFPADFRAIVRTVLLLALSIIVKRDAGSKLWSSLPNELLEQVFSIVWHDYSAPHVIGRRLPEP